MWYVLAFYGRGDISIEEVADWCHAGSGGYCAWDIAVDGLSALFDVENLEDDWEAVTVAVEESNEPVVVTIAHPFLPLAGDHPVVLLGVREEDGSENLVYMDPMTGVYETRSLNEFLPW